jgi:hypothetical protein
MIGSSAMASTSLNTVDAASALPPLAAMPVASKIKSIMSDFFVRAAGFNDIAAAMA